MFTTLLPLPTFFKPSVMFPREVYLCAIIVGFTFSRTLFHMFSQLTRMHSSRMRTVCSSSHLSRGGGVGGLPQCMLGYPPQGQAPTGADTPPDQAPPRPGTPLGTRHPPPPWTDRHQYNHNPRNFVADGKNDEFYFSFLQLRVLHLRN